MTHHLWVHNNTVIVRFIDLINIVITSISINNIDLISTLCWVYRRQFRGNKTGNILMKYAKGPI